MGWNPGVNNYTGYMDVGRRAEVTDLVQGGKVLRAVPGLGPSILCSFKPPTPQCCH